MEQIQSLNLSFKCARAFNTLLPCEGGWYCNGCEKLVHDFRGKPETEIRDIFAANNYKLCGMFEADRIRVNAPLPKWRKYMAAAVLAVGFTGIHQTLIAQHVPEKIVIDTPKATEENQIFGGVENSAEYPGGIEKFYSFVKANLVADASCLPGQKAFLSFVVEKDGSVSDVKVFRSPFNKKMNEQMISIIKRSPKWKPGNQKGKIVKYQFAIPITPVEK